MFHLLQLLVKLVLNLERDLQDNTKLVGSLLIGGLWLLLLAAIFPAQLGIWREWFIWGGWILVGLAAFLFCPQENLGMERSRADCQTPFLVSDLKQL